MTPSAFEKLQTKFDAVSLSYCAQYGFKRDQDWVILKLLEEVGELTQAWNKLTGRARKRSSSDEELMQNLAEEAADVLGMIMVFAVQNDLDLEAAIKRKWRIDLEEV